MKQRKFMVFKGNNRYISGWFYIYVLIFFVDNIQSSNFFTQSFENDSVQILPVHMDQQLNYKFNQVIWRKKSYFKNKIKNLSKKLPLIDVDKYEKVTMLYNSAGYYAFEDKQLHLFFHEDEGANNKITLNFVMAQNWTFDNISWILINKQKKNFRFIVAKLSPINYNETLYYGVSFGPYADQMSYDNLNNNLELYQSEMEFLEKFQTNKTLWNHVVNNHILMKIKCQWDISKEKILDFFDKPVIKENLIVWFVMIFEIYCMFLIYKF